MNKMELRRLARAPWSAWERRDTTPEQMQRFRRGPMWRPYALLNNRYSIQLSDEATDWGLVLHLWVRRHDGEMVRSWSDLQRIKNEIAGPSRVALEVFPPADELVDEANMAHLWVLPEGFDLPFGLRVSTPGERAAAQELHR